jgi:hypothetical protein
MITAATTLVLLAERRAQDVSAGSRSVGRATRSRQLRAAGLLRRIGAGFPPAAGRLNVSSADVDPRPSRSS